jgi:hypothetical protein
VQPSVPPVQQVQQPTPEEQRIQTAYESEQKAMATPTSLRDGFRAQVPGLHQQRITRTKLPGLSNRLRVIGLNGLRCRIAMIHSRLPKKLF